MMQWITWFQETPARTAARPRWAAISSPARSWLAQRTIAVQQVVQHHVFKQAEAFASALSASGS